VFVTDSEPSGRVQAHLLIEGAGAGSAAGSVGLARQVTYV
jgi:hypothetical protein